MWSPFTVVHQSLLLLHLVLLVLLFPPLLEILRAKIVFFYFRLPTRLVYTGRATTKCVAQKQYSCVTHTSESIYNTADAPRIWEENHLITREPQVGAVLSVARDIRKQANTGHGQPSYTTFRKQASTSDTYYDIGSTFWLKCVWNDLSP